ncbi:MAG: TlpA family protein disulfide reductase [Euryarchaeota archaeon]|nr:TlpA family protein disulfide reductase [Euryarchaeota archaeon]
MTTTNPGVLLLVALTLVSGCLGEPASDEGLTLGKKAPDFAVTTIDGVGLARSDTVSRVFVLDIMGVNCPPCREEMPHLVALHDEFNGSREFLLVSVDTGTRFPGLGANSIDEIRQFKSEFGANWTFAYDNPNTGVGPRYQPLALPTLFIVDATGKIIYRNTGITTQEKLSEIVSGALGRSLG